jgi:hypothetical protein
MAKQQSITNSVNSAGLADVLERILDKGLVIVGDIKIKLVDIELLTIQIRLLIASVDKAREIGIDWWMLNPEFSSRTALCNAASPGVATDRAQIGPETEPSSSLKSIV